MVNLDLSLCKILQLNSPRMRKNPFWLWFMFPGVKMYPCLGLLWVKYKQGEARLRNWGSLGAPLSQTAHHGPIPVAFGPEIKYNTFNLKLYHCDIQNFPSLLCVANAALAAPSLTPAGACDVYKGKCVLWARLRIKRRPGNKKRPKSNLKWHEERLAYKNPMFKLWQMSHAAATASHGEYGCSTDL